MVAQRRLVWNFALQRAVALAAERRRPLLILEALRTDYPWASDRHHAFLLEGMREHEEALRNSGVGYYPYVEPKPDAGSGLLAALAARAVCVVTDDHPGFFYPRMLKVLRRKSIRDGCRRLLRHLAPGTVPEGVRSRS